MKIEVKRMVRPIRLCEYVAEYGDETVWTWANPPRSFRARVFELADEGTECRKEIAALYKAVKGEADEAEVADEAEMGEVELSEADAARLEVLAAELERIGGELNAWWAELWSQSQDTATHWTADDVSDLLETARDADPQLWDFLQGQSFTAMQDYRDGKKKG